ncbi:hypothetical protein BDQ12DRAFT_670169 [Crucibulum laeve]|uniref:Uncharacterized protein n=1 Tax=Crucibulum laeve TaxID=68775 RepID=A0A5C3LLG1_9AGAR|nr:hypothetical protein BDQ12DRAFT_670169 [Crucibulum laeve]
MGHQFAINPETFYQPKYNIQYSLGGDQGGESDVFCENLLVDSFRISVPCSKELKTYKYYEPTSELPVVSQATSSSYKIVFKKNSAFFCAIEEAGYSFESDHMSNLMAYYGGYDSDLELDMDSDNNHVVAFAKAKWYSHMINMTRHDYSQEDLVLAQATLL